MINLISVILFQVINVNSTTPCFFNYTAGANIFQNCGMGTDYLRAFLLPWQWVTGGLFSMIIVSIIILMSYIKYQKIVYPLVIGIIFLPISYAFFPVTILNFAIIIGFIGIGLVISYIFISQTNET